MISALSGALGPDPFELAFFCVTERHDETADTFVIELSPNSEHGFHFEPGQFNMLYAFGVGEVPISISGHPSRPDVLHHTIRAVGPVTRALQRAQPGTLLGVRGPYGRGWPMTSARGRDVVVVAGGVGLAPLRPAILELLEHRDQYGHVAIVYGARSPDSLLFGAELERWGASAGVEVHVTVDRGDPGWSGHTGVVTKLLGRVHCDPGAAVAFLCGPEVMMRFAARELSLLGYAPDRQFVSTERNMKCAVGLCGRCQLGTKFVCRDGPVFGYAEASPLLSVPEL